MFVEVISLQHDIWRPKMALPEHKLGLISGVPQILYTYQLPLPDHHLDEDSIDLSPNIDSRGANAAYRCAQLFFLESYLVELYSTEHGDYDNIPRIVTGFWRMYEYEFAAKIPTCFQDIPKIGLTIVLDFGEQSESEPAVRRLIKKYKSEGELCMISVSYDNWKDKILAEIETRFDSAFSDYYAKNREKVGWLRSEAPRCYDLIEDDVPF